MADLNIRTARISDINQLVQLEKNCFESDQLSRRSFRHFIVRGSHEILILEEDGQLSGYALVLYRRGTNLARLYSIAILPDCQGRGLSKKLLAAAEAAAANRYCVFLRLEVSANNAVAIQLYESNGYRKFGRIHAYYDNGDDALRMEKKLHYAATRTVQTKPYYQQTTEFTCGPACLMMALKSLDKNYVMSRREEMQIWRESTTIFMTSGHGGCSPYGLALSAWQRGMKVDLYINQDGAPFLESVRDPQKRTVIELVHKDFLAKIEETDINVKIHPIEIEEFERIISGQGAIIALISTWRLNRNKAPHWIFIAGSDEEFIYMNDSDLTDEPHQTQTDFIQVPIERELFREMAKFGRSRLKSFLVLRSRNLN